MNNINRSVVSPVKNLQSKPNWKRSTTEEKEKFQNEVDSRLRNIDLNIEAIGCQDVHCNNVEHTEAADALTAELLKSVEEAAYNSLHVPKSNEKGKKPKVPGWNNSI